MPFYRSLVFDRSRGSAAEADPEAARSIALLMEVHPDTGTLTEAALEARKRLLPLDMCASDKLMFG